MLVLYSHQLKTQITLTNTINTLPSYSVMHVLVYHWSCYPKPDCCTWTVLMSPGRRSLCPIDKGLEITSLVLPSKRLKDTDICFAFIGWLMMCCTDGWVRMTGWIGMALGWWDACINTHSEGVHVKVFTGNNVRGSLSFLLHKLWDSPLLHFWWGLFHASAHHYRNNPYCTGPFLCTIDMYCNGYVLVESRHLSLLYGYGQR